MSRCLHYMIRAQAMFVCWDGHNIYSLSKLQFYHRIDTHYEVLRNEWFGNIFSQIADKVAWWKLTCALIANDRRVFLCTVVSQQMEVICAVTIMSCMPYFMHYLFCATCLLVLWRKIAHVLAFSVYDCTFRVCCEAVWYGFFKLLHLHLAQRTLCGFNPALAKLVLRDVEPSLSEQGFPCVWIENFRALLNNYYYNIGLDDRLQHVFSVGAHPVPARNADAIFVHCGEQ